VSIVSGIETPEALELRAGARTDVGRRRAVNEDSLIAQHPMFVVADGMGGHDAGDRASHAVIAAFTGLAGAHRVSPDDLTEVLARAHASVKSIADGTARGAGSTVTGVVVTDQGGRPHWLVFNIGDSRVYRLRGLDLEQLTVDHSVAQEKIEDGSLLRADLATYKGRNVITKAVGAINSDADYWLYPIVTGERLIVCSDGLSGELSDGDIRSIALSESDPQRAADALISAALEHGGRDNVTVIVLDALAGGVNESLEESTIVVRVSDGNEPDETTIEVPRRGSRRADN
jgi:PPM family protein phosphatase